MRSTTKCLRFIAERLRTPARKRKFVVRLSGVLSAALLFVACATNNLPGEHTAVVDSLYFGTAMPGGQVTESDWQQFVANVITPRFPKGVTSWAAAGQWQNRDGSLSREKSYVVLLVHPNMPQCDHAISEIVSIYKKRFRQEAVLRMRSRAQVSFQ
jgi:hypothetical protein